MAPLALGRQARSDRPCGRRALGPDLAEVGTFKDNKSAPVHRWFQYPAGFSYRAVEVALDAGGVEEGDVVLDPFAGTGTTLVVCKGRGVQSRGLEAHPLVAAVARSKVAWDLDLGELDRAAERFLARMATQGTSGSRRRGDREGAELPSLLRRCYGKRNLQRLSYLRQELEEVPPDLRPVFTTALVGALRGASGAATGWPYIAPRRRIEEHDAFEVFERSLRQVCADLAATPPARREVPSEVLLADARAAPLRSGTVDLAFTSPPYLNNYDYADRLRLESYFLGMARTWGEISERFRGRLIVSATTQVVRSEGAPEDLLGPVAEADEGAARDLRCIVTALSRARQDRAGHKSYDLMVARYFVDMTRALRETLRLLRPEGSFILILGDSAPYGVPVPTEELLGRIAVGVGFRRYAHSPLRRRGEKWRSNPQRHHVPLKESWLVLEK